MKICILVLYTESWQELADIVLPNLKKYAKKHLYYTHIEKYEKEFSGFEKLVWCKKLLEEYDVIWSLDMDTFITNHTIRIEQFINKGSNYRLFFITKDYNGINAGSFIIQKDTLNAGAHEWLLNEFLNKQGVGGVYCEQDAISLWHKEHERTMKTLVDILPHPSINSYKYELYPEIPYQTHEQGQWQKGDFILHLPGIGINQRVEIFNKIKEDIIYE